MTVKVYWLDEDQKDIVMYEFEGRWTWEDLYPEYDKAIEMEKSQPHRVDVILDFEKSQSIPPNILTHMKTITDKQPDNIGLSVIVTRNSFFNVMYRTGTRFYSKIEQYFVIVDNIDAAHEKIAKDRQRSAKAGNEPQG